MCGRRHRRALSKKPPSFSFNAYDSTVVSNSLFHPHSIYGTTDEQHTFIIRGETCKGDLKMLYWALVFLLVAIVAGALGFGGIAGAAGGIAHIIFYVFLVLLLVSLIMHFARGSAP
jgi:uncharacterized membrane protein YtjA (UPF0391 family)